VNSLLIRTLFSALLAGFTISAAAQGQAATRYPVNLPPSVELQYAIKAKQKGIPVEGDALVKWNTSGKSFSVSTETRAMLIGKILEAKSDGTIDEYGLAPLNFLEKRFRKEPTSTTFDRKAKVIRFGSAAESAPIKGGEQDRSSAVWQLISIARAASSKFKPGSEWIFTVAGQRDAEAWRFRVVEREKITAGTGEMETLHVVRELPQDHKDNQLDIWLAPGLEWYPVRLRFSEENGDFIEQTLQQANRKAG
jgi:hypothetical protein